MKSPATCLSPEELHQSGVWYCLALIISVCKTFLPGQASSKSGQLLGDERYHTCDRCVLPLLRKLTFPVRFSEDSNIVIVDQNSTSSAF